MNEALNLETPTPETRGPDIPPETAEIIWPQEAYRATGRGRVLNLLAEEIATPQQLMQAVQHPRLREIVSMCLAKDRERIELKSTEYEEAKAICDEMRIPPISYGWVIHTVYQDINYQLEIARAVD